MKRYKDNNENIYGGDKAHWSHSELTDAENEAYETERANQKRRSEIIARLNEIDRESARPLRATVAGTNQAADDDKLVALESEAVTLRDELANI